VPTGAIEQQNGVGALGDVTGYFLKMKLHGECVGVGQSERRAFSPRRADGAKEISAFIALIGRLAWP